MAEKTEQKIETIADRLKAIRLELKLSQKEFAERLGLDNESVISVYEAGTCEPSALFLIKLEQVFGVDLHELLTGRPEPGTQNEIESLRKLKHEYRLLLNDIRSAITSLKTIDGKIKIIIQPLDKILSKYSKRITGDDGGKRRTGPGATAKTVEDKTVPVETPGRSQ